MLPIYYIGCFICSGLGVFSNQKYARSEKKTNNSHIYSLVTGLIAMAVFYIFSGFHICLNLRTVIYSIVFAVLIFANYFFVLGVFRYMGIAEKSFICSGLSLIITTAMSCFFFKESFEIESAAQLFLIFLTFAAIFISRRKNNETVKTVTAVGVAFCVAISILGAGCTIVSKAFAEDSNLGIVTDENSFFFLTNVFITAFAIVTVLISQRFSVKSVIKEFKSVSLMNYFMIVINVVSSNLHSLFTMLILKEGNLILYAPLNSALALLAGEVVAVLFVKEKPRIAATILALSSVLVVLLF